MLKCFHNFDSCIYFCSFVEIALNDLNSLKLSSRGQQQIYKHEHYVLFSVYYRIAGAFNQGPLDVC